MTAAPPAVLASGGPGLAGLRGLPVLLGEFPGSVAIGIALHVGFAAWVLVVAVRWAREALLAAPPEPPPRPRDPGRPS